MVIETLRPRSFSVLKRSYFQPNFQFSRDTKFFTLYFFDDLTRELTKERWVRNMTVVEYNGAVVDWRDDPLYV